MLTAMIGLTMKAVLVTPAKDEMYFISERGRTFRFYHEQECCETVEINDITGDLDDLTGTPLLLAAAVNSEPPSTHTTTDYDTSETWTFYKFATRKGYVDVRWLGSSNGYYSENVNFEELGK
jgi:hypothetical protein